MVTRTNALQVVEDIACVSMRFFLGPGLEDDLGGIFNFCVLLGFCLSGEIIDGGKGRGDVL